MIKYDDCLKLGFKRKEMSDHLFFNQNGYEWFLVSLKINKEICFEWDCETKIVSMVKYKGSDIKNRRYIENIETLKNIVTFFTDNNPKSKEVLDSKEKVVERYNVIA